MSEVVNIEVLTLEPYECQDMAEAVRCGQYKLNTLPAPLGQYVYHKMPAPPEPPSRGVLRKLLLVHLPYPMTPVKAIPMLEKMGLLPGELHELLAVGAQYPEKQTEFPVVAAGTVFRYDDPIESDCVPDLGTHFEARHVGKHGLNWVTTEHTRFLAVELDGEKNTKCSEDPEGMFPCFIDVDD